MTSPPPTICSLKALILYRMYQFWIPFGWFDTKCFHWHLLCRVTSPPPNICSWNALMFCRLSVGWKSIHDRSVGSAPQPTAADNSNQQQRFRHTTDNSGQQQSTTAIYCIVGRPWRKQENAHHILRRLVEPTERNGRFSRVYLLRRRWKSTTQIRTRLRRCPWHRPVHTTKMNEIHRMHPRHR